MTQSQPTAASAESIVRPRRTFLWQRLQRHRPSYSLPQCSTSLRGTPPAPSATCKAGAALPPLTPIDTLPTHPQLLMSLAFEAWWTNANWHSEWLELLEEAQQHHARRSLVRLHNRAAEHADRPRELIDVTARRARRAALRCVRVQLARGLRGFVAQQDRRLNAARSMRRAARYYDRVRISHAMHLLLAKRDVRRNLEDLRWRSFLGRRAALLAWRSACIDWRASCARRDILFRRAIQRMATGLALRATRAGKGI